MIRKCTQSPNEHLRWSLFQKLLTAENIFLESSILDIRLCSEYASVISCKMISNVDIIINPSLNRHNIL